MAQNFKPKDFNSISPYLLVRNMDDTLSFLNKIFDSKVIHQHTRNNVLVHVSIKIDDSVVMLGQLEKDENLCPTHVHAYVQNVKQVFDTALKLGAIQVQAPSKRDDGDTRGAFKDMNEVIWWIGQQN